MTESYRPFGHDALGGLLQDIGPKLPALQDVYGRIPTTECLREATCCSLQPETTLVEALAVLHQILDLSPVDSKQVVRRIVSYFFLNPVEITACPFLSGRDCLVYENRFLGCRSYGLWSEPYYEKLAAQSRQGKAYLHRQWEEAGVPLPRDVVDLRIPYCRDLRVTEDRTIDDATLVDLAGRIEELCLDFSTWNDSYQHLYFSDLGFLLTSLALGLTEAVRTKFSLVKGIIATGDRTELNRILADLPDILCKL